MMIKVILLMITWTSYPRVLWHILLFLYSEKKGLVTCTNLWQTDPIKYLTGDSLRYFYLMDENKHLEYQMAMYKV